MKVTVVANLTDAGTMLRKRGLESGGRVQKLFTNECWRHMDPYVPMESGLLKNTANMPLEGDAVIYNGPYARYQYYGKVMVGRAPKQLTDRDLVHSKSRHVLAGPFWDTRMWADKGKEILEVVAKAAGGRVK